MKTDKKLLAAISLGLLSSFLGGVLTASAAELTVKGGPENTTLEQMRDWYDGMEQFIAHKSEVANNKILLDGGVYKDYYSVWGALANEGDALNNSVTLRYIKTFDNNGPGGMKDCVGGYAKAGSANGNSVTIDGFIGKINRISGGEGAVEAKDNTVNIKNLQYGAGEVDSILGGQGMSVVSGNRVSISGENSFSVGDIYGGNGELYKFSSCDTYGIYDTFSKSQVLDNRVEISGSGRITSNKLIGGRVDVGDAKGNVVNISGDVRLAGSFIAGGFVIVDGNATNNEVNISGNVKLETIKTLKSYGDYTGTYDTKIKPLKTLRIYGGAAEKGEANNNKVTFNGVTFNYDKHKIIGGYSGFGNVNGNIVKITSSNRKIKEINRVMDIVGGRTEAGNAISNSVVVFDSSLDMASIYGADAVEGNGKVEGNYVGLQSSHVNETEIIGGNGGSELIDNDVVIGQSSINGMVCGARGANSSKLMGNSVKIRNSNNISNVAANTHANIKIYGGYSYSDALVQGNYANIYGSTLLLDEDDSGTNKIVGGRGSGIVKENGVVVSKSQFEGLLIGGQCDQNQATGAEGRVEGNYVDIFNSTIVGDVIAAQNNVGTAIDNSISIAGKTDVSKANLIGAANAEKSKGNNLVLDGWSGNAKSVAGFDIYKFANIKDASKVQLSVGSVKDVDNGTEFDVHFDDSVKLANGQKLTLIASDTAIGAAINKSHVADIGAALEADGALKSEGNNINFEISAVRANKQTNIVGAANVAAASFVADGAQLAVDGMEQMSREEYGINTFAAAYGSDGDYDNGVSLKGWNTMVGVGNKSKASMGDVSWGVFYETGSGEMQADNSYRSNAFIVDGKAVYNGVGAAMRLQKGDVYYEAGLRAGKLKNNMSNALSYAYVSAVDEYRNYGYKTEGDYLGYHVGVGKEVKLANGNQLDVYARYYHTELDGASLELNRDDVRDAFSLDKVYSDRVRVGGRYTDQLNEAVKVYYGAAYEYEFSGEGEGKVNDHALNKSDLGGSSYMGEIGLLMNNPGSDWTVDMALQARGGQYDGVGGKVQATYHF